MSMGGVEGVNNSGTSRRVVVEEGSRIDASSVCTGWMIAGIEMGAASGLRCVGMGGMGRWEAVWECGGRSDEKQDEKETTTDDIVHRARWTDAASQPSQPLAVSTDATAQTSSRNECP